MWYNKFMIWILRSPLHGMLDKSTLLVTVSGRKSGRQITTPVNYVRDGDTLWVTSTRQRAWWRNLRGGAPLTVRLGGVEYRAAGEALESESAVADGLRLYFKIAPQVARYFQVQLDASGQPLEVDLARTAQSRVAIRIDLQGPKPNDL